MNEWEKNRRMAEQYRQSYPPGTRVLLLGMDDPYAPVPSGTKGTVAFVDDQSQIHMRWDNGRGLALVPGKDSFRRLTEEELAAEQSMERRIEAFNQANPPFYLVDHDDGTFSLCLPLDLLTEPYRDFGQEAFNQYAEQIGEPAEENGLYTHGNGYEWESVFKKAFDIDDALNKISFDCEAGGIFCDSRDLSALESLGSQFRNICLDKEGLAELVCTALDETAATKYDEKIKDDDLFDEIKLLGQSALFTNERLENADLPEGLYCYHLRHGDDGEFCAVERKVAVNHGGAVITREPIDFGEERYISFTEETSPNFTGESMTLEEFMRDQSPQEGEVMRLC